MRLVNILLFFLFVTNLTAQEVYIDFDNCLVSNAGLMTDPVVSGNTTCDCGVEGESLFLESADAGLEFDSSYTSFFQKDFTLSFEFMLRDANAGVNDIFSVSSDCGLDSSLTIKYLAGEEILRVQIARDFGLSVELDAKVNTDMCWHQVVFVRNDENYFLYLDGAFVEQGFTNGIITLDPQSNMRIGNSPCLAFGENAFQGKVDELKIYDRPLSVEEIFAGYKKLDDVLTRDTTIFSGTSIDISSSESCADIVSWFPSSTVSQSSDLEPTISPTESTLYSVRFDYGICRGLDSITIAIIDEDAVDCDNLLLPNAFTPNNDGLNDFIGISNSFIIEELRDFEIFDRWGEKVFSTQLKTDEWDGVLSEQKVNSNVFLYKVNYSCKGDDYIKTGSFSILR